MEKNDFDGMSYSKCIYTVIDTVIIDGMSIEFIGTHRKRKTPTSFQELGFYT